MASGSLLRYECVFVLKKVLNYIKFEIWGGNGARNPKFEMRVFNVVEERQTKGFFLNSNNKCTKKVLKMNKFRTIWIYVNG